jgi:hypothetical protein
LASLWLKVHIEFMCLRIDGEIRCGSMHKPRFYGESGNVHSPVAYSHEKQQLNSNDDVPAVGKCHCTTQSSIEWLSCNRQPITGLQCRPRVTAVSRLGIRQSLNKQENIKTKQFDNTTRLIEATSSDAETLQDAQHQERKSTCTLQCITLSSHTAP